MMTKEQIAEILYNAAENYWLAALEQWRPGLEGQPHPSNAGRPRRSFSELTAQEKAFYETQAESLLQRAEVKQR